MLVNVCLNINISIRYFFLKTLEIIFRGTVRRDRMEENMCWLKLQTTYCHGGKNIVEYGSKSGLVILFKENREYYELIQILIIQTDIDDVCVIGREIRSLIEDILAKPRSEYFKIQFIYRVLTSHLKHTDYVQGQARQRRIKKERMKKWRIHRRMSAF